MSIKGKTSLNSLVGIGSKIQVDGLEETIAVVNSERSTGQKRLNTNQVLKMLLKLLHLMISDNSGKDYINLLSDRNNFIDKESHEIITAES